MMDWQPIETCPKDEMFIWAYKKGDDKWSVGLAYRNVSGGWSDAYGDRDAPKKATHWFPMPMPPAEKNITKNRVSNGIEDFLTRSIGYPFDKEGTEDEFGYLLYACGNTPRVGDIVSFGSAKVKMLVSKVYQKEFVCGAQFYNPNLAILISRTSNVDVRS